MGVNTWRRSGDRKPAEAAPSVLGLRVMPLIAGAAIAVLSSAGCGSAESAPTTDPGAAGGSDASAGSGGAGASAGSGGADGGGESGLKLVGGLPIGVSDEMVEHNGFLFVGHGEYVLVYNLTPSSVIKDLTYNDYSYRLDVGAGNTTNEGIAYERGIVRGMVQDRGFLYTCSDTGITIWDVSHISSSSAPVQLSKHRLVGACWDLQIDDSGSYLYAAKGSIKIVKVTDKNNPEDVKGFGASYRRFFLHGNYIYTAAEHTSSGTAFRIYDISDPTNPSLVSTTTLNTATSITGIWSDGEYAYLADYTSYLGIVNVSDKQAPVVVNLHAASSAEVCPVDLKGRDNKLYVSGRYQCGLGGGLYIYDITDRTSPSRIMSPANYSGSGLAYVEGIALGSGDLVYVGNNTKGVAIYDTSGKVPGTMDPTNALFLGGNIDSIVAIGKDVLLAGDHNDTLWTFDISNMSDIKVLDRLDAKGRFNSGIGLTHDRHYAFCPKVMYGGSGGGFFVVDISDPTHLVIVNQTGGQVGTSHGAVMSTDGNTLFTQEAIFDVTNPVSPVKKYDALDGGSVYGHYISRPEGNYILSVGGASIVVKNVTDLSAPYRAWTTPTSGAGTAVRGSAIAGNTLIAVKSGGGQHIITFDISDLSNIRVLQTKTYGTSGLNLQQVAIDPATRMAFVSGNNGDMRSFSVVDPANFHQVDVAKAVGNNYGGFGFDPSTARIFTGWETGVFIFQAWYSPQ
jgi:hypothetical protein